MSPIILYAMMSVSSPQEGNIIRIVEPWRPAASVVQTITANCDPIVTEITFVNGRISGSSITNISYNGVSLESSVIELNNIINNRFIERVEFSYCPNPDAHDEGTYDYSRWTISVHRQNEVTRMFDGLELLVMRIGPDSLTLIP